MSYSASRRKAFERGFESGSFSSVVLSLSLCWLPEVDLAPLPDTKWKSVAVGGSHACALDPRGTSIYCWGLNTSAAEALPSIDGTVSTVFSAV